jgi:hypothetical protein
MIEAVYAYGTLDSTGSFIPVQLPDAVIHAQADITDYATVYAGHPRVPDRSVPNTAALAALRSAGVAPNPSNATETISVPNKKADDFKVCDLDVYFSFIDPRLSGTYVSG